jgi:glycosyltransferase involved in cell wall biosynthesis
LTSYIVPLQAPDAHLSNEGKVAVSVIIPSKDEESTIGICIGKIMDVFDKYNISGEIIVSDSSEDRTPIIATKLGAKVITPDKSGYGYAYLFAFKHSSGRYIVMGDADSTYDFGEIPKLLEPLEKDEVDMVIGNRFNGKMEQHSMPWHHRYLGNPILTGFLNLFFKAGISDAHSGFRAITREDLNKLELKTDGMEFASEMIVRAVQKGLRIKEVPISYYKRISENSKLSSFSDGWRHLRFMLFHAPNYLFIYPGVFLLLLGIFLMSAPILDMNIGFSPGIYSTILGALLAITGYQVIFFGLFAMIQLGKTLSKTFTLEKGGTVGALLSAAGFIYAFNILLEWMQQGYGALPLPKYSVFGLLLIVFGIQTFFSSFMLSIIADLKK